MLSNCILGRLKSFQRLFKEGRKKDKNIYFIVCGEIQILKGERILGNLSIGASLGEESIYDPQLKKHWEENNIFTAQAS